MTASVMRGLTINLSSVSPILFTLEDGTVLNIVEKEVVEEWSIDGDGKCYQAGPPRLVFTLKPAAPPNVPEPSLNGTHAQVERPPEKRAGYKQRGSGV